MIQLIDDNNRTESRGKQGRIIPEIEYLMSITRVFREERN